MMKREEVTVLNRAIGVADANQYHWWEYEEVYENFVPAEGINLLPGTLKVDYVEGYFRLYNEHGQLTNTFDIVETLKNLPYIQKRDY